jgi:glycerol uptake facilitator protein
MNNLKEYLGELIGTFVLVFIGCGAVGLSIFSNYINSLLEVAFIFGAGVSVAIFTVRSICPAHLNPAVSIAMFCSKKLTGKKLPFYMVSQFLGALLGALVLYVAFAEAIDMYEQTNTIVRGSEASVRTAMMFGEYFPNPGYADTLTVSHIFACFMEGIGTFILVFVIFRLTNKNGQVHQNLIPVLIGLTVMILICFIAPYTQGGFNPARDFSPRIVAYFAGWKSAAFPSIEFSFMTVYMVSPIVGGIIASYLNKVIGFKS